MKYLFFFTFFLFAEYSLGQNNEPALYGFRHLKTVYRGDSVDILVWSKKGEELKKKPILLFIQGSLPVPLIIRYEKDGTPGIYHVFVFNPDMFSDDYHLAIVAKPNIPLVTERKLLSPEFTFKDSSGGFPKKYIERNYLDYYVNRDIAVIKFLQTKSWVSDKKLVLVGHSEGSTIAAKIAYKFPKVTALIYSGGNPCGLILSIIEARRSYETQANDLGDQAFQYWKDIVNDSSSTDASKGEAFRSTFGFSIPPMEYLEKLKIPVLVSYGTKDPGSPFNDYFRVMMIRQHKENFTFTGYIGLGHNYFPLKPDGATNYDVFNWDKVAFNWRNWLKKQ